jgi:2-polyprenyl-3-methyl-5-hydroxy-6-metoxy-1,4-benzoquinol methylase
VSNDYTHIAPIYDTVGMADFAEGMTPRLIVFAQSNDWLGRRILDLGSGTGASVRWLANRGYNTTAIDSSPDMIEVGRRSVNSAGLGLTWRQGDIRKLESMSTQMDMVLALDVINELQSLRDLEAVFGSAMRVLEPGKLFIFDLHTIEGLASRSNTRYIHDDDKLAVVATDQFDYERQINTCRLDIFRHDEESGSWVRQHGLLTRRGFPVQAVAALLQRTGFAIMALFNTNFEPIDPVNTRAPRVIFVARKAGGNE